MNDSHGEQDSVNEILGGAKALSGGYYVAGSGAEARPPLYTSLAIFTFPLRSSPPLPLNTRLDSSLKRVREVGRRLRTKRETSPRCHGLGDRSEEFG